MTPETKAKELVNKYLKTGMMIRQAKECALVCLNEIYQTNPTIKGNSKDLITMIVQTKAYYYQVESEINKL